MLPAALMSALSFYIHMGMYDIALPVPAIYYNVL